MNGWGSKPAGFPASPLMVTAGYLDTFRALMLPFALCGHLQSQLGTNSCGHTSVVRSWDAVWFSHLKSRQMRPGYHALENMFNDYLNKNLLEVIY